MWLGDLAPRTHSLKPLSAPPALAPHRMCFCLEYLWVPYTLPPSLLLLLLQPHLRAHFAQYPTPGQAWASLLSPKGP